MEGLVAVGLASNILQFVSFATSIVSNTKKFYENASGAKDEYQDAEDYAQRLQRLAAQVATPQAPYGGGVSVEEKELKELCERCSQIANELLEATRGVTATSHKDWVQSAGKAVKASLSSSQIKSLQGRLDRIGQELTGKGFQIQLQNTERALSGMAAENRRLSSRRDEDIRHLQEQLQHVTRLLENGESQRDIVVAFSAAAKTGAPFTAEELIVRRLFFHDMNERHTNVHVEHEKTLSWIFEENSPVRFTEFLESQSSLYWVSGKPGSGKSTAMKYICQHSETQRRLEKWANGNRLIVAKYFFWNAGKSSLLKSQEGLLQSILYQIFRAAPALIPHTFPDEWTTYLSGGLVASLHTAGSFSFAQLLEAFQLLCANLSDLDIKICIFVDGLDEYDGRPGDVIRLIEALKTSTNIKACVSSRPWNEFERAYGQDQRNKLYMQDLTKSDIKKYVRDTLEEDETFRELVESEGKDSGMALVHYIVDTAQGVFLWVILVVRSLLEGLTNADTLNNLQRRLRSLPTDLDEYFERILFSVDDFYSRQAAAMCLVTLTAVEPLPLMSYWFMDQGSSRYALDLQVDPMRRADINSRIKTTEKRLNACCKGLLEPSEAKKYTKAAHLAFFFRKVHFLHRTVRDFLRIPRTQVILLDRLPKTFNPHAVICQALLAFIKTSPFETAAFMKSIHAEESVVTLVNHLAALEDEAVLVQREIELVDEVRSTLDIHAKHLRFRLSDFWGDNLGDDFLVGCVLLGLLRYIYEVVEREPKPSSSELASMLARTADGDINMFYGGTKEVGLWSNSQLQLTRNLLRAGADPNAKGGVDGGSPWTTLLDEIVNHTPTDRESEAVLFSILEEYTNHGCNLQSIKRGDRGISYYKNQLRERMTKDQFDAFLRLADSKKIKDRLASGPRRIARLFRAL